MAIKFFSEVHFNTDKNGRIQINHYLNESFFVIRTVIFENDTWKESTYQHGPIGDKGSYKTQSHYFSANLKSNDSLPGNVITTGIVEPDIETIPSVVLLLLLNR
jgi:hypothetical protein